MKTPFSYLLTLTLCLQSLSTSAQTFSLQGRQYVQQSDKWYSSQNGQPAFEIIPQNIIVRRINRQSPAALNFQSLNLSGVFVGGDRLVGGYYLLSIAPHQNPFSAATALETSGWFDYIEFNSYGKRDVIPNDALYANTAEEAQRYARMQMPLAWEVTTGSSSVILANIDSGVEWYHEDLAGNNAATQGGNIWQNLGEDANQNGQTIIWNGTRWVFDAGDLNGVDNDGNGKADDLVGWNFAGNPNGTGDYLGDNNPDDFFSGTGHGTPIAGITSARTNNALGVAGLAGGWGNTKGVLTMSLRDGFGLPDLLLTARAVTYAAQKGAKVINISSEFGGSFFLQEAIDDAIANYDAVIVASSGNDNRNVGYPAILPNVIAVGAVDPMTDQRSSYSNFGPELDVVASGFALSTIRNNPQGIKYQPVLGTSFAAPHVAALATLIRSVNPALSYSQVREVLINTADKTPYMSGSNFHVEYGYGRINALKAVVKAASPTLNSVVVLNSITGPPTLYWSSSSFATMYRINFVVSKSINNGTWMDIATLSAGAISYTDPSEQCIQEGYDCILFPQGTTFKSVAYRVRAVYSVPDIAGVYSPLSSMPSNTKLLTSVQQGGGGQATNRVISNVKSFQLSQNYPNPFNPTTVIRYDLPKAAKATLVIYDMLGRAVLKIVDKEQLTGSYSVAFDGSLLSSGVYFYRLQAGEFTSIKKMMLLK